MKRSKHVVISDDIQILIINMKSCLVYIISVNLSRNVNEAARGEIIDREIFFINFYFIVGV